MQIYLQFDVKFKENEVRKQGKKTNRKRYFKREKYKENTKNKNFLKKKHFSSEILVYFNFFLYLCSQFGCKGITRAYINKKTDMRKIKFLKSLLVAFGLLVTSLTTQVWAWSAGINSSNGANLDFRLDGKTDFTMTVSGTGTSDYSTQTVRSSLVLRHAYVRTWKDKNNGNVCHIYLHYRIYKSGVSPDDSWRTIELGDSRQTAEENNQIKQEWSNTSLDIELTDGTDPGTWYFEYFFTGDGSHDGNNKCGDTREFTYSNGGSNYKIPFVVGYDTRCTMSATNKFLFQNHSKITNLYAVTEGSGESASWPGKAVSSYSKIIGKYRVFTDGGYYKLILNDGNSGWGHQSGDLTMSSFTNKFWFFGSDLSQTQIYESPLRISYNHYGVIWGEKVQLKIAWNNSSVPDGTYSVSVTGATIQSGGSGSISGNTGSAYCWIQLPESGSDGTYIAVTITYIVDGITFTIPSAIYVINPKIIKVRDDVGFNNIYLQEKTPNGVVWQTWPGDLQESLGKDANSKEWYLVRLNPTLTGFWLNNGSSNKQTYDGDGWGMNISGFNNGDIRQLLLGTGDNTPYEEHCWLGGNNPSLGVALYRIESYDGSNTYYSNAVDLAAEGDNAIMSFYADLNNESSTYKLKSMAANSVSWSQVADIDKTTLTAAYSGATATAPGNVFTAKLNSSSSPTGITDVAVYENDYYIHCGASTKNYLDHGESKDGSGTQFIHFNKSAIFKDTYDYYWVDWFPYNETVVASVGNDYNDNLAGIIGEDEYVPDGVTIGDGGNARFGYDPSKNLFFRSMLAAGGKLVKISSFGKDSVIVINDTTGLYNLDASVEARSFDDATNWVYTLDAKVLGTSHATVKSSYNGIAYTLSDHKKLLAGYKDTQYEVEISYDFKTNRVLGAWMPESGETITGFDLQSNLMVVRREDSIPTVLNITGPDNKVTGISKIYTTFEIWRKSWKDDVKRPYADRRITSGNYIDEYYWFSLPYKCYMGDVFGIEGYGPNGSWVIMTYHGDYRARDGWWAETESWWYYLDRTDTLQANQGYVLRVTNLDGENAAATGIIKRFPEDTDPKLYLYFPSFEEDLTIKEIGTGTPLTVQTTVPEHICEKWRGRETNEHAGDPSYDRRAIDSNWNIIGSPSFNTATLKNTDFSTDPYPTSDLPTTPTLKYFFTWSAAKAGKNKYTIQDAKNYQFKALSAYLVQYAGTINWEAGTGTNPLVGITKASAPAQKESDEQTLRLVLNQNGQQADVAYISRMAEGATEDYDLNKDLSKMMNAKQANLYTISGYYKMAGNCIPDTVKTLKVGVRIAADGEYTFSLPEGTQGTGVTLVDNVAGAQTNLALTDYTVTLPAGTYDERFVLLLSPIANTPTGIETISDEGLAIGARKVMVDGALYIIKDNKVFDAQGRQVK